MPDQVKITVFLPVYNVEKYVGEAITSILNQTYKNFELIIMNDGSTDNSDAVIRTFKDPRIVYIHNPVNMGVIKGPNTAMKRARGEYIARMDADDIAMPQRLEKQLRMFETRKNAIVVASDYYLMKGDKLKYAKTGTVSEELKATLLFAPCFAQPTVMIKNIFAQHPVFYDERAHYAEDYKWWIDLSELGEFYSVSEPLLKYRSHPAQVSNIHRKIQLQTSEWLREYYLGKKGFVFTPRDLKTHHAIGNNVFISSLAQLKEIETWLLQLIRQNENNRAFEKNAFAAVLNKFWYDSCGYTNLGLKAYHMYFGSEIARGQNISPGQKIKLLIKCLVRRFRH